MGSPVAVRCIATSATLLLLAVASAAEDDLPPIKITCPNRTVHYVFEPTQAPCVEACGEDGWRSIGDVECKDKVVLPDPVKEAEQVESVNTAILKKCTTDWPGDFIMQKSCKDQQEASYSELDTAIRKSSKEERKIFQRCIVDWAGEDGKKADWIMVMACSEQQLEAYRAMGN